MPVAPEELVDWVALNLLQRLSPLQVRRALRELGSPEEVAFRLSPARLAAALGLRDGAETAIVEGRNGLERRAEEEVRAATKLGIRLVTLADPDYPAALETLPDGPILLYVRGALPEGVVRIAIVGSRRGTAYGRRVATALASGLALRAVEIVSGGARGIDTCAHLGALEGGGRTVAVMGSGFRCVYPPENEEMFDRVAENGAVITEFPLNMEPRPENFPRRNRIISGLSAAVVVVEAAERSGSLITAAHALDQGREVMAVPGPVTSDQSAGCHRLIQQGAKLVHAVRRRPRRAVAHVSWGAAISGRPGRPPTPARTWTGSPRTRLPFWRFWTIRSRSSSRLWPTGPRSVSPGSKRRSLV